MKHLRENNETYLSHLVFAGKIGLHLLFRGVVFVAHAIAPLCDIPSSWNLENLSQRAKAWNDYAESRTKKG